MLALMGVKKGVSDLFLAYPVGQYSGFWLELKAPGKKPNSAQMDWLKLMESVGYAADWYDDWGNARAAILEYLNEVIS